MTVLEVMLYHQSVNYFVMLMRNINICDEEVVFVPLSHTWLTECPSCSVFSCSVFSCDNVMFQAESRFGGRVNSLPYNDSVLG